jgi:hypothetical protein
MIDQIKSSKYKIIALETSITVEDIKYILSICSGKLQARIIYMVLRKLNGHEEPVTIHNSPVPKIYFTIFKDIDIKISLIHERMEVYFKDKDYIFPLTIESIKLLPHLYQKLGRKFYYESTVLTTSHLCRTSYYLNTIRQHHGKIS